ncbi:MAG: hypothetical protein QME96_17020, partial [Myxococcota bacterium]|nr:hypothetical protein [Myxococcota bacterium]
IERRIPMFPLSRETTRLDDLKRSLALYRLVFGQPRQEDLVRLLRDREQSGHGAEDLRRYQVDLAPPSGDGDVLCKAGEHACGEPDESR